MKLKENAKKALYATKGMLVKTKNNILYGNIETDRVAIKRFMALVLPILAVGCTCTAFAAVDLTGILKFVFQGLGIFMLAAGGIGVVVEIPMFFMARSEEDDQKETKAKSRLKQFVALAVVGGAFFAAATSLSTAVNTLVNSLQMG